MPLTLHCGEYNKMRCNKPVFLIAIGVDAGKTAPIQVTDEVARTEGQGITHGDPDNRHDGRGNQTLHQHGYHILRAN